MSDDFSPFFLWALCGNSGTILPLPFPTLPSFPSPRSLFRWLYLFCIVSCTDISSDCQLVFPSSIMKKITVRLGWRTWTSFSLASAMPACFFGSATSPSVSCPASPASHTNIHQHYPQRWTAIQGKASRLADPLTRSPPPSIIPRLYSRPRKPNCMDTCSNRPNLRPPAWLALCGCRHRWTVSRIRQYFNRKDWKQYA